MATLTKRAMPEASAVAQRGAQLVEPRELAIAELDVQPRGSVDQGAHRKSPNPDRIIRII